MEDQINFERLKIYLYEDTASEIYRLCFIFTYASA